MRLAREGGPDAVVLRAASREAGVSHSAAYRHFADHDDLLATTAQRCLGAIGELMEERLAGVTVADPVGTARARLEAIGRAYVDFAVAEPGWFRTAFTPVSHRASPPGSPDGEAGRPDPYAMLAARLDELVQAGAIPPQRRPAAEHAAWATVHGLASLFVDGPLRLLAPEARGRSVARALDMVQRGL